MSNTHYQIMLLLFLIIVVVYVSGCKLHEGIYVRKFNHADYTTQQAKYDFIYDKVDAAGATTEGDYTKIMNKIHEIEHDILDFSVCNAPTSGTSQDWDAYKPTHETRTGGKCANALTKGEIGVKITALTGLITAFKANLGTAGSTVTDLEIAKILDPNAAELDAKYHGWGPRKQTPQNTEVTVKTASSATDVELQDFSDNLKKLRVDIDKSLKYKSNQIKEDRTQLDSDLAELNQLGNSQAGVNKMTMDSTVYASLIWSVLATSLIAYLVTTI